MPLNFVASSLVPRSPRLLRSSFTSGQNLHRPISAGKTKRCSGIIRCLDGGGRGFGPGPMPPFLPTDIMQKELMKLISDQKSLIDLGKKWKRFDREGKVAYVESLRKVCERWDIFLKRFELAEDFQSQCFLVQLDETLKNAFGMSRKDLRQNAYDMLETMERKIDEP